MQVRKQQLELEMEQQTGSQLGKEYVKAVYCHLAYLTYMQRTSCEILGWMKHKVDQDCQEKYQQDIQMIPPLWEKERGTEEPLDEGE